MVTQYDRGTCDSCQEAFQYYLLHCGFDESAYAYCESCGSTLNMNLPFQAAGYRDDLQPLGLISRHTERALQPCPCGGRFRPGASPRCPYCASELSAEAAAAYIEANAPGTPKGFRWQRDWVGIYCMVIQDKVVFREYSVQRRA